MAVRRAYARPVSAEVPAGFEPSQIDVEGKPVAKASAVFAVP
jgi:hypothetical protein